MKDIDIPACSPLPQPNFICAASSMNPPLKPAQFCVSCSYRHPKCLAASSHSTSRKMMFFHDNAPENGQNQQASQFFQYHQAPVLPHAVASVGRATPLDIRRERSPNYLAASSSSRTAKSGHWSMMPPKRSASGSPSGTPGKIVKTEQKPEDFSNSVKKRLQSSTRTGQACDRCKVIMFDFIS